jgi:hypothetical protein
MTVLLAVTNNYFARRLPASKVLIANQNDLMRQVIDRVAGLMGHHQSSYLCRRETTSFDCLSPERKATIDPERIADGRWGLRGSSSPDGERHGICLIANMTVVNANLFLRNLLCLLLQNPS